MSFGTTSCMKTKTFICRGLCRQKKLRSLRESLADLLSAQEVYFVQAAGGARRPVIVPE